MMMWLVEEHGNEKEPSFLIEHVTIGVMDSIEFDFNDLLLSLSAYTRKSNLLLQKQPQGMRDLHVGEIESGRRGVQDEMVRSRTSIALSHFWAWQNNRQC